MFGPQRFDDLWQRIGAKGLSQPVYHDLVWRYSQRHRAYHVLRHIEHCLEEFEKVRVQFEHPDAAEFALYFHDSIEETHPESRPAIGNVAASAELAGKVLTGAGVSREFVDLVEQYVMDTAHKEGEVPTTRDGMFVVDIDLAIFGQPRKVFDEYEENIRREYFFVPQATYREVRKRVLERFYSRPSIYFTPYFVHEYEAQARENLARSITALS